MPDSFQHTVETLGFGQATFEQCWFASYKMMLKVLNRPVAEVEAKLRPALGTTTDDSGNTVSKFDDAMAYGLIDRDYKTAADALGLQNWPGTTFKQKPGTFDFGLSDGCEAFLEHLKAGPLWVSIRDSKNGNHAVVAVGYDDDNEWILYNNPYPGPKNAVLAHKDANTFAQLINAARGAVAGKK